MTDADKLKEANETIKFLQEMLAKLREDFDKLKEHATKTAQELQSLDSRRN